MEKALARLVEVDKWFARGKQRTTVFERFSLSVARGDFLAIMGPSGSGKTTTLNLLGGVDRPNAGAVEFDGGRIDRLSEGRRSAWRAANVGFVFQFYNLMPALSALENVELPLLLTNLSAQRRRENASAALAIVDLSDRARHKPKELSGGQQQRVAIARAVASDPQLLLCDEPTGDLDRESADNILSVLQLLNRKFNKTIVMVTHDPEAAKFAQRTLHLDKGRVTQAEAAA